MDKIDAMVYRVKTLASGPAHWKAVTMCRHLYQAFCRVSREHVDPTIVRQQTWPLLDSAGHSINLIDITTDGDAVLRVHIVLPSPDTLLSSGGIETRCSDSPGEEQTRYGDC